MFKRILLIFVSTLGLNSFAFSADGCEDYIRPIKWGWMSSAYGVRTDPFTAKRVFHEGLDFASKDHEKAYASKEGVVTFSEEQKLHGNRVEITHENGYITAYSHLGNIIVQVGDEIEKGQVIGVVGPTTGRSTGPHVGFELIIDGKKVNPIPYMHLKNGSCSSFYLLK